MAVPMNRVDTTAAAAATGSVGRFGLPLAVLVSVYALSAFLSGEPVRLLQVVLFPGRAPRA
jgi:hypothetical protein